MLRLRYKEILNKLQKIWLNKTFNFFLSFDHLSFTFFPDKTICQLLQTVLLAIALFRDQRKV